jgi:hypothetical protein
LLICVISSGGCGKVDPNHISVNVRPCLIEGSPGAEGHRPGEIVGSKLSRRIQDASRIWEAAKIGFYAPLFYPVIKDPIAPKPGGFLGDVDAHDDAEPLHAVDECRTAWAQYDPDKQGIFLIDARTFVNSGLTLGVTPSVDLRLTIKFGGRGDDLCGQPRKLVPADLAKTSWTILADEAFFVPGKVYSGNDPVVAMAHELGHVLTLGHGNGLDDNHDGLEPPDVGRRRFDEYCDASGVGPNGVPIEESGAPAFQDCATSSSLMRPSGTGCRNLRALQIEQARVAAVLIPGTSVGGVIRS